MQVLSVFLSIHVHLFTWVVVHFTSAKILTIDAESSEMGSLVASSMSCSWLVHLHKAHYYTWHQKSWKWEAPSPAPKVGCLLPFLPFLLCHYVCIQPYLFTQSRLMSSYSRVSFCLAVHWPLAKIRQLWWLVVAALRMALRPNKKHSAHSEGNVGVQCTEVEASFLTLWHGRGPLKSDLAVQDF